MSRTKVTSESMFRKLDDDNKARHIKAIISIHRDILKRDEKIRDNLNNGILHQERLINELEEILKECDFEKFILSYMNSSI